MTAKPWIVKPLTLPVGDKQYVVQPVDYKDGLTLIDLWAGKSKEITAKSPQEDFFKLVMGATWQQMLDDNCSFPVMFRAGMAAGAYQAALVNDLDSDGAVAVGESTWESGVDPEAVAAALAAATQRNSQQASKRSTSTASARKTPPRASTRTTTSRKTTRPTGSKGKAASKSATPRSSSSGR